MPFPIENGRIMKWSGKTSRGKRRRHLLWHPRIQLVQSLHHVGPLQDGGPALVALMEDKVTEQLQQVTIACRRDALKSGRGYDWGMGGLRKRFFSAVEGQSSKPEGWGPSEGPAEWFAGTFFSSQ